MNNVEKLKDLANRFQANLAYYKDARNNYNEHSCRIEFIDPLLKILGWDVANEKGLAPQYREVIAENYSTPTDRPDYTMTLRGVAKFFVEAKKPAVDIARVTAPAFQTRKYGWNANHRIAVLTNFEYLAIYDTCYIPKEEDGCAAARYRIFHFSEYADQYYEIASLISRDIVYSGEFDKYLDENFPATGSEKQQVDTLFLKQINEWRVSLSNELYRKGGRYKSLEVLNDVVQEFINQIVFLRICEDKSLPLYHKLQDTVSDSKQLQAKLEELFRSADRRYNSGLFSGDDIVFDLSSAIISEMIKGLYYPQSPYLFNIIEPNLLGKIYELFLTEQLVLLPEGTIGLGKKKDCLNKSVVTTPTEIVKYMVEKTLSRVCEGKTPAEILNVRIADIACGSGVFLEEAFSYLQNYCVQKYLANGEKEHLLEIGNGSYKLPLDEKKRILCSCIYGIDIDIHAVEVAKFSLLVKLIENETAPSVVDETPILPDISTNILFGNSLVSDEELQGIRTSADELIEMVPFDWNSINSGNPFSVIIGNPPYVNTEGMHALLPVPEVEIYKKKYKTSHKQFDKYFIFIEQAIRKIAENGYICYIVPNKFFKIGAGEKLRALISKDQTLVSLDDFGDAQLFEDKTIYSSILLLQKKKRDTFIYSSIDSANRLWSGEEVRKIELNASILNKLPWRLTTDIEFLEMLQKLDPISVSLTKHAEIFNGIQTSAERPTPIYWFSTEDIIGESQDTIEIRRDGHNYTIEKAILRPYFKPTRHDERGLNSYSVLQTDKRIIFPYDSEGHLIPIDVMKMSYPGTYAYLEAHYDRLVPKCVSDSGVRDVPNATEDTWYQYGRTQALTAFINTQKLIVGVLSKEPMYILDNNDILIASGGTAGYCAVSKKADSPYALEYIQAWLTNPITEKILEVVGSDFEGGFIARGTFVLSTLPFVELDFENAIQKGIYNRVVEASREVYEINTNLSSRPAKRITRLLQARKNALIKEIEGLIAKVYRLDF
ncbi:Eco57I restriction-modification methylase domain-containing protein [Alloscardovia omnicolens]|uniref:Eco57I restriction-modification methylase domain-containing protein n=1 Tax=Alloscardovia omnicolens TaxID=419015 RepID=UPI003A6678E0